MRFIRNVFHVAFEIFQMFIGYIALAAGGCLLMCAFLLLLCGTFKVFEFLFALSAAKPVVGAPLLILAVAFALRCALRLFVGPTPQQPTSVLRGPVLVKSDRHSFHDRTQPQHHALVDSTGSPSATATNTPAESGNTGRFTFRK